MNLQTEEKQAEIVLSPESNITELLRLAKLLHNNPAWRTTLFSGESGPSSSVILLSGERAISACFSSGCRFIVSLSKKFPAVTVRSILVVLVLGDNRLSKPILPRPTVAQQPDENICGLLFAF